MKKIFLTRGKYALVDDEDYELVSSKQWIALHGKTHTTWYAVEAGNPGYTMHRFLMQPARDMVVHHRNDNGLDNRRQNLIVTTQSGNILASKIPKGYHYESSRNKWMARITIDGKFKFLGRFNTEEEAKQAYQQAKSEALASIFGEEE